MSDTPRNGEPSDDERFMRHLAARILSDEDPTRTMADRALLALARLQTVALALVQDAQAVSIMHHAGQPPTDGQWSSLYASLYAVRAILPPFPHTSGAPIPSHLHGRVWRVRPASDPLTGRATAELATDDSVDLLSFLVIADSAEDAIRLIMHG
jgi:hypothetical protein